MDNESIGDESVDPDKRVEFGKVRKGLPPIQVEEDEGAAPLREISGEPHNVDLVNAKPAAGAGKAPAAKAAPRAAGGATVIDEGEEIDDDDDELPLARPAAPQKPVHDAADVAFARELGLPEAEIAESTPGELRVAIRYASRLQRQAPARPEPAKEPDFDLGLTKEEEELLDPAVLAVHRKVATKLDSRAKAVEKQLADDKAQRAAEAQLEVKRKVDVAFAALKQDSLFGSDPSKLSAEHVARRRAVLSIASQDRTGRSIKVVIREAVATLYPGDASAEPPAAGGRLTKEQARWLAGGTPPAKAKREKPGTSADAREAAAVKKIHEKYFAAGTNGATVNHGDDGSPV